MAVVPAVEEAILNHHNPEALTAANPLLLYLDLGNKMCRKMGIGFIDEPELDILDCPANRILGLDRAAFEQAAATLQVTLESEMEIYI